MTVDVKLSSHADCWPLNKRACLFMLPFLCDVLYLCVSVSPAIWATWRPHAEVYVCVGAIALCTWILLCVAGVCLNVCASAYVYLCYISRIMFLVRMLLCRSSGNNCVVRCVEILCVRVYACFCVWTDYNNYWSTILKLIQNQHIASSTRHLQAAVKPWQRGATAGRTEAQIKLWCGRYSLMPPFLGYVLWLWKQCCIELIY